MSLTFPSLGCTVKLSHFAQALVLFILPSIVFGQSLILEKTISVGTNPSRVVIVPTRSEVYVTNHGSNSVSVINTATGTVSATIPVGLGPDGLVASADGTKVYVGQSNGGVSVINTATKVVTAIPVGTPVRDIAISPDDSRVFVAMEFSGLRQILTSTNQVSTVSPTSCPEGVAVTPDGSKLYVNYQCAPSPGASGHDPILIYNPTTAQQLGSIAFLPDGRRIANVGNQIVISPNGAQAWATGGDACLSPGYDHVGCPSVPSVVVNVIRTSDNSVVRSIGLTEGGLMTFSPDSTRMYTGGAALHVFDTTTFQQIETLPFTLTGSLAFSQDGVHVYAPSSNQSSLLVFRRGAGPNPNANPIANAGGSQNVATGGLVTLSGLGSSDPDRDPLTFAWSIVTKPATSTAAFTGANTATPTFVADVLGTYVCQLTVNDGRGGSSSARVTITATAAVPPGRPPVANAGADLTVQFGSPVLLDGRRSADPDGDPILKASWKVLESPPGSSPVITPIGNGITANFSTNKVGTYQIVLTVLTRDGSASDTLLVRTQSAPPPPPPSYSCPLAPAKTCKLVTGPFGDVHYECGGRSVTQTARSLSPPTKELIDEFQEFNCTALWRFFSDTSSIDSAYYVNETKLGSAAPAKQITQTSNSTFFSRTSDLDSFQIYRGVAVGRFRQNLTPTNSFETYAYFANCIRYDQARQTFFESSVGLTQLTPIAHRSSNESVNNFRVENGIAKWEFRDFFGNLKSDFKPLPSCSAP